jgi:OmpA-OmpF porin, OOP family
MMKPKLNSHRRLVSNLIARTGAPWAAIGRVVAAVMAIGTIASTAQAQNDIKREFSVHRFDAAPGPRNFFVTRTARSDGNKTFSFGFLGGYGKDPFVITSPCSTYNCTADNYEPTEMKVIKTLVTGDLMGSFTLMPKLQFGLRIPVVFVNGQGLDPSDGSMAKVGEGKKFSLGDPMVEAKYRFLGKIDSPFAAAGALFFSVPLGHAMAEGKYVGDVAPSLGLRAIADFRKGPFSAAGNLVGMYRKNAIIGKTLIGRELRYSAAAGYDLGAFTVMAEVMGHTRFNTDGNGSNGLEALLGGRFTPAASPISFQIGGGLRLIEGAGVPVYRAFAGLLYTAEPIDGDGDGILDSVDACPKAPEDLDGRDDSDGCPDDDNDGDRFVDASDKCPNEAEDIDGFEDTDGCPDADNDKDGVPDERDTCRDKPETKNGFKDEDGCPDVADTDNDGVPDTADKCPSEPEDTDGFSDTDGCPDLDNDNDGVPDTSDECSEEPETANGFEDTDGCPDEDPKKKK